MSIMNEQGQVGRFAEVGYTSGIFDRGSSKLGLQKLSIVCILGSLLDGLSLGQSSNWHAIMVCVLGLILREIVASRSLALDGGRVCLDRISTVATRSVNIVIL